MMEKDAPIFIAGADTMIGQALIRYFKGENYSNVTSELEEGFSLRDYLQTSAFFDKKKPDYVFLAAGLSGGILANQKYPADLILDNLRVNQNVIQAAFEARVKKLLYIASSCCYPKYCDQPIREEYLLKGPLEPTNEAYAIAKIAGISLCRAFYQQHHIPFITGIVSNPFGPCDDFHPENSHVVAGLIRKVHEAKTCGRPSVEIWGSGKPKRDFIYVDDIASACRILMEKYDGIAPINIGGGIELSIAELTEKIKEVVGFPGKIQFDTSRPDGMPLKILDATQLKALGWSPFSDFKTALAKTYDWFLKNAV